MDSSSLRFLHALTRLSLLGDKRLYFGVNLPTYDAIRLLICHAFLKSAPDQKSYLVSGELKSLKALNSEFSTIALLVREFEFAFDASTIAKFERSFRQIVAKINELIDMARIYDYSLAANLDISQKGAFLAKIKELKGEIDNFLTKELEEIKFELDVLLTDTHKFYACGGCDIWESAAFVLRKKILALKKSIKKRSPYKQKAQNINSLKTLLELFGNIFGLEKLEKKLNKIALMLEFLEQESSFRAVKFKHSKNLENFTKNSHEKALKYRAKVEKKCEKLSLKLTKISKKLKSHYK